MNGKKKKIKQEIVNKVIERASGYCEKCGKPAAESMALHHRKLKSRGGQDSVANLIWVHHECHNLGTNSIHANPSYSTDKGWMVGSWQEPSECPFVKPDGTIILLHEDGNTSVLMEGD